MYVYKYAYTYLHIYMYIYIYICVCVCVYIQSCIHIQHFAYIWTKIKQTLPASPSSNFAALASFTVIQSSLHMYICIFIRVCINKCMHIWVCVYISMYIWVYVYISMCVYIYIYVYKSGNYIYVHTNTYQLVLL